jgi:hypothetical protein
MAILLKQYTIGDVMNIDSGRQERAGGCMVSLDKTYHELKEESILDRFKARFLGRPTVKKYYVIFRFIVTSDKGHKHYVYIRLSPDFDLSKWKSNKIKIFCDCADFKFRSAYILAQHDSLFMTPRIQTELGPAIKDAPRGKQPTSLLCKHAFAALNYLVGNYTSLMKTI